jgi:CubicO group peptidase (beta-lactamase class C family)
MTGQKMWRIRNMIVCASVAICLLIVGLFVQYQTPILSADEFGRDMVQDDPKQNGIIPGRLQRIDSAVEAAISEGEVPGAVVLVSRKGRIEYFNAFGNRSVQPKQERMTRDTIFDISSLTKVLATTPSIMLLVERGLLRLDDPVNRYLPGFKGGGKDEITVHQLLTHYSGLPADLDLSKNWFGYDESLEELWKLSVDFKPGKEFVYSDVNFIALGEIVHAVSGQTIDVFARENIFVPLGMTDTCYRPPSGLVGRIAPTESRGNTLLYLHARSSKTDLDKILRGEVHDPTAYRMGGVAGHAGLFSSAKDMAVYAQMLLDGGTYSGGRLLSPMTVQAMSRPQSPPGSIQLRGYGWDIRTDYSSPRGDIFEGGFGHTGFTGTSLWIHPPTETFVVILSNRVHPNGGQNMNHLRSVVANIVASSISDP